MFAPSSEMLAWRCAIGMSAVTMWRCSWAAMGANASTKGTAAVEEATSRARFHPKALSPATTRTRTGVWRPGADVVDWSKHLRGNYLLMLLWYGFFLCLRNSGISSACLIDSYKVLQWLSPPFSLECGVCKAMRSRLSDMRTRERSRPLTASAGPAASATSAMCWKYISVSWPLGSQSSMRGRSRCIGATDRRSNTTSSLVAWNLLAATTSWTN